MKTHFCVKCAFGIPFSGSRPSFCPDCGSAQSPTAVASQPVRQSRHQEIAVEDDHVNVEALAAAVVFDTGNGRSITLKDTVGTASAGDDREKRTKKMSQREYKAWEKNLTQSTKGEIK